ncbi:MAG: coenzyme F420-0:L-glutamate ligase [Promethearchaeota archaeon]
MQLFPIKTRVIKPEDDTLGVILDALSRDGIELEDKDILVIAETALGTAQGRLVKLDEIKPSKHARELAAKYRLEPGIAELIIREADMILGGIPHVLLTIKNKVFMANAGIDKSNAPLGYVSLLPKNPTQNANELRIDAFQRTGKRIGVIIADSRTQPLRLGTVGLCIGVSGIMPVTDERGHPDIFGRPLQITRRATADNLASAAEVLMGEADERVPAVLIRGAPVEFTDEPTPSDLMYIPLDECMYMAVFKHRAHQDNV